MPKTGLVFFPAFDWSISPEHPEREERLLYTRDQIFEEGIIDDKSIIEYKPRMLGSEDVQRVHFCVPDIRSRITSAHMISAGSSLRLADAVFQKKINNGFALVRPPGHHAMRIVHGNRGFCDINNVAILVEYIRSKYNVQRIAVVDTDVHHGDGTQDIFYHDPDVLFISMHQDGRTLYPGTGFLNESGGPGAYRATINIPLPPGTGDKGFLKILERIIMPAIKQFAPEIIINSAGQDNHFTDPLANMKVTAIAYAQLTNILRPDIAVLEGGYAVQTALPYVNLAILLALAGKNYSRVTEPQLKQYIPLQSSSVTKEIDHIIDYLEKVFSEPLPDKERLFGPSKNFFDHRKIYYDTDNIWEEQKIHLNFCPNCQGFYIIESSNLHSFSGTHIKAVSIPLYACKNCREKALSEWDDLLHIQNKYKYFDYVYIQDKQKDFFQTESR